MAFNQFDGPIPGQSLTKAPGSTPWEQPPAFNTVDDAMDYLTQRVFQPRNLAKFVAMIEAGMPVEGVARTLLLGGFMDGKWNMDLVILLAKPVMALLSFAYVQATKKKPEMFFKKVPDDLAKLMRNKIQEDDTPVPEPSTEYSAPKTGLMGAL